MTHAKPNKEKAMKEYKVEVLGVKESEARMNALAREGWRVVATSPNIAAGHGVVVTFEREKDF
jgi:hypothetical protein